jgi:cytosine permease
MTEDSHFDEQVYQPVQSESQYNWVNFLMIFIGMWASLGAIAAAVALGTTITVWKGAVGLFVGYLITLVAGLLIGEVGRSKRLSTAPLLDNPFSSFGGLIPKFFVFLIGGVFIGIQVDALTRIGMAVFGIEIGTGLFSNRAIIAAVLTAVMMYSAYKGIDHIQLISWIGMPIFLVGIAIFFILTVMEFPGGLSSLVTQGGSGSTFWDAAFLGVSLYAGFTVLLSDVSRFIRTRRGLVIALIIGYVSAASIPIWGIMMSPVARPYWLVFGQFGFALSIFAIIGLVMAQWTTNDNNAYTSGLALATFFTTLNRRWETVPRLDRSTATAIPGTIAVVFAFLGAGAVEPLLAAVSVLGSWLPPLGGILIAHYYVVERNSSVRTKGFAGLIAWIGISLLVQFGILPLPALTAWVASFLAYLGLYFGVEKPVFGTVNASIEVNASD